MKGDGVRLSVCLSIRMSQHVSTAATTLLQVRGQEMSVTYRSSGGRMRAVPRCQRM